VGGPEGINYIKLSKKCSSSTISDQEVLQSSRRCSDLYACSGENRTYVILKGTEKHHSVLVSWTTITVQYNEEEESRHIIDDAADILNISALKLSLYSTGRAG
jgi:hypothetical protein